MLETILNHMHNWFPSEKRRGAFEIVSGALGADFIREGQYYRIIGSVFNDGLHRMGDIDDTLTDEAFDGEVWALAVPKIVVSLAERIREYREKNPESDKLSESFGGYSYSRGTDGNGQAAGGWQAAFRSELNAWKRVSD